MGWAIFFIVLVLFFVLVLQANKQPKPKDQTLMQKRIMDNVILGTKGVADKPIKENTNLVSIDISAFENAKYAACFPDSALEQVEDAILDASTYVSIPKKHLLEAEKEYSRRLESDRFIASTASNNNEGIAYEKSGDIENAIKCYEDNITGRVIATHSYDRLSIIYNKQKRYGDLKRVLEIAIEVFTKENEKRFARAIQSHPDLYDELNTAMETNTGLKKYFPEQGREWYVFNPYNVIKYIQKLEKIKNK